METMSGRATPATSVAQRAGIRYALHEYHHAPSPHRAGWRRPRRSGWPRPGCSRRSSLRWASAGERGRSRQWASTWTWRRS